MAYCKNCGTKLEDGANFCPKCGQQVNQQPETKEHPKELKKVSKEKTKKNVPKSSNKEEAENDWKSGCGIWLGIFLAICILVYQCSDDDSNASKPFKAIEDGRAAYCLVDSHYEKSDLKSISKIIMYKGNGRQDCKAEGVNGEGELFSVVGKWEKKDAQNSSCYFLDYKHFKLLIRDDSLVCYYKGDNDNESSINQAWDSQIIGKIKDLSEEAEIKVSKNFSKKMEEQEFRKKPIIGSKDIDYIKKKLPGSIWTYTETLGNPIGRWYRLKFSSTNCDVYHAMPKDGGWKHYYSSPYTVIEKRLDDGKRYVFVYLKYSIDTDGSRYEPPFPIGINITEGSYFFGAMGAIGYINEKDYEWD